ADTCWVPARPGPDRASHEEVEAPCPPMSPTTRRKSSTCECGRPSVWPANAPSCCPPPILGSLIVLNLFLYSSTHSAMFLILDAIFALSLGVRGWMAFGPNDAEEAQIR